MARTKVKAKPLDKENLEKLEYFSKVSSVIGHEIKGSIASLGNYVNCLYQTINTDDEESRIILGHMTECVFDCKKILEGLARLTNLEEPCLERADLGVYTTNNIEVVVLRHCPEAAWYLEKEDIENGIYVNLDNEQFKLVLKNIINNAVQSMEGVKDKKINVSVYKKLSKGIVKIEDIGCGIPDDCKEKIFNNMFTTKEKGWGIGLGVVSMIMEKHRGQVWFESEEGLGTAFYISFPIIEDVV